MSGISIQNIKELVTLFDGLQEKRHIELKKDLHILANKVDEKADITNKRLVKLETAESKRADIKSWWKPIVIGVFTAVIVGGITYYGS